MRGNLGKVQSMSQRVVLDAMFPRADFATEDEGQVDPQGPQTFTISAIETTSPHLRMLRKPLFQRETNHWTPEQVVDFIASFVDWTVIPGLILWNSPCYMFIVDGGHRLSALRAWIEDDYGDNAVSREFFKGHITRGQKKIAERVRKLVEQKVGRFSKLKAISGTPVNADMTDEEKLQQSRANRLFKREIPNQWITGNATIAEESFYKINTQGTALEAVEELLIRNRRKPIAIGSRAILRAGTGHKYWSEFGPSRQLEIENLAAEFYKLLIEPEVDQPIKTLDLPLVGTASPIDAQQLLVEYLEITGSRKQVSKEEKDKVTKVAEYEEDQDGQQTIAVLRNSLAVVKRITGTGKESLGLHPAVYFYTERGRYSRFMFLGLSLLITERLRNNDSSFFKKFTTCRAKLEGFLITHRSMIGIVLQQLGKNVRVFKMRDLLEFVLNQVYAGGEPPAAEAVLGLLGLQGQFYDLNAKVKNAEFTDEAKSTTFIRTALDKALTCSICGGKLDPQKAMSYDHDERVRDGGLGGPDNMGLTHPYCNTGFKN